MRIFFQFEFLVFAKPSLLTVMFLSSQSENVGSRVDIRAVDNKPPDQYTITNSLFIPILLALGRPYIEAVN